MQPALGLWGKSSPPETGYARWSSTAKAPKFTPKQWCSTAVAQFLTAIPTYAESETCNGLT